MYTATFFENKNPLVFLELPLSQLTDLLVGFEKCHGGSSFKTDANSEIMLLHWFENKSVQLASIFSSAAMQHQKSTSKYLVQTL